MSASNIPRTLGALFALVLLTLVGMVSPAQAQLAINGDFNDISSIPFFGPDCVTSGGSNAIGPAPWGLQSTPDLSSEASVSFNSSEASVSFNSSEASVSFNSSEASVSFNSSEASVSFNDFPPAILRTSIGPPSFDISPDGGCYVGFRSISLAINEGVFQTTMPIADVTVPLQFRYECAEYTDPGETTCVPQIEFRIDSTDDSNGVLLDTAPNIASGDPRAPTVEANGLSQ